MAERSLTAAFDKARQARPDLTAGETIDRTALTATNLAAWTSYSRHFPDDPELQTQCNVRINECLNNLIPRDSLQALVTSSGR